MSEAFIVCIPRAESPIPMAPSNRVDCAKCNVGLWISKTVQKEIPDGTTPICLSCATQHPDWDTNRIEVPPEALREVADYIINRVEAAETN